MAHPHVEHRQHHVEKRRARELTSHYASGGAVKHSDAAEDKKLVKGMVKKAALRADGGAVKARADRPARKKGGRVNHKGTTVNVITGGHAPVAGLGTVPMAPPPMAAAPPPMPPRPPMMAGPPPSVGGPGMSPGAPPGPPMMPHSSGGRTYKRGGRVGVNTGSKVYEEGVKAGTQVSHDKGKSDLKDLGRGKPITYRAGGKVQKRAAGGPLYSESSKRGPEFDAGAGGGEGRIEKTERAKKHYKAAR